MRRGIVLDGDVPVPEPVVPSTTYEGFRSLHRVGPLDPQAHRALVQILGGEVLTIFNGEDVTSRCNYANDETGEVHLWSVTNGRNRPPKLELSGTVTFMHRPSRRGAGARERA